jgi:hypothetical protein
MSYTDLAIWIDANAYLPDVDEMKLYKYLYLLSEMLARQYGYFTNNELYDTFAIFSASRLLLRMRGNVQQIIQTHDAPTEVIRIKSILNYLKKVIYPYKVDFDSEYSMRSDTDVEIISLGRINVAESLSDSNDVYDMFELVNTLQTTPQLIKDYLSKFPRCRTSGEWHNIYVSCLLTLVDQMTLTHSQQKYLRATNDMERFEVAIKDNLKNPPILYHLDDSYENLIIVLVREIRHLLSAEMHWKSGSHFTAEAAIKAVIMEALSEEEDEY